MLVVVPRRMGGDGDGDGGGGGGGDGGGAGSKDWVSVLKPHANASPPGHFPPLPAPPPYPPRCGCTARVHAFKGWSPRRSMGPLCVLSTLRWVPECFGVCPFAGFLNAVVSFCWVPESAYAVRVCCAMQVWSWHGGRGVPRAAVWWVGWLQGRKRRAAAEPVVPGSMTLGCTGFDYNCCCCGCSCCSSELPAAWGGG